MKLKNVFIPTDESKPALIVLEEENEQPKIVQGTTMSEDITPQRQYIEQIHEVPIVIGRLVDFMHRQLGLLFFDNKKLSDELERLKIQIGNKVK